MTYNETPFLHSLTAEQRRVYMAEHDRAYKEYVYPHGWDYGVRMVGMGIARRAAEEAVERMPKEEAI